jgi:phytoene desaturase
MGGVHKLTEAMAKAAQENGAKLHLDAGVKEVLIENGRVAGVRLDNGSAVRSDFTVMSADFGEGMKMVPDFYRPGWTDAELSKKPYSCSTFMLYLGLRKKYDLPHHNIFFADDYRKNIEEIFKAKTLPADPSFYIQNASVTDPSLAPEGKSAVYVLVPVPNLDGRINWEKERYAYRDLVIRKIKERAEMTDIDSVIEAEKIIAPNDWQAEKFVYKGGVFNLAHSLGQMLYLRPHNKFESLPGLYLAGGGTHPGSGLPTIVESGRISADLISGKL